MNRNFATLVQNISIIDVLTYLGYKHDERAGKKFPRFVNPDTGDKVCVVNPHKLDAGYFSQTNQTDRGGLYNFIDSRINMGLIIRKDPDNYKAIMEFLREMPDNWNSNIEIPSFSEIAQVHSFVLDEKDIDPLNNKSFLYSRKIDDTVINAPAFKDRLYSPSKYYKGFRNNVIVPLFNKEDQIVGLEYINNNFKFKVKGSERSESLWIGNILEKVDQIVVTENVLDGMSHYALCKNENTMYLATQGALSHGQIDHIVEIMKELEMKDEKVKLYLAFDNDQAGKMYDLMFLRCQLEQKDIILQYFLDDKTKEYQFNIKVPQNKENKVFQRLLDQNIELEQKEGKLVFKLKDDKVDLVVNALKGFLDYDLQIIKSKNKDFNDDLKEIKHNKKVLVKRNKLRF